MTKKKFFIALLMMAALTLPVDSTAQGQPPVDDPQELVDSTRHDALEAYSDTTNVPDTTVVSQHHRIGGYVNGGSWMSDVLGNIGFEGMMGMAFVIMIVSIIFIIAPVLILAVIFFFIYKNRKQKMKLAQMAMQQGQRIPDELLVDPQDTNKDLWQNGIRQTFLGVGLLAFFGYLGSTLGIGIGILVTFIGLGKLAIVKTSK